MLNEVPPDDILGLLLFTLYLNDVAENLVEYLSCADDLAIVTASGVVIEAFFRNTE